MSIHNKIGKHTGPILGVVRVDNQTNKDHQGHS